MDIKDYRYDGKKAFHPDKFDTKDTAEYFGKESAAERLRLNQLKMAEYQDRLYADGGEAVLIIFQAMDAAGKDGAIKHVMKGLNPQGIQVTSFKQPTAEELSHDYLWRAMRKLPARGYIGIFNRSYYEDVLVVKVRNLTQSLNIPVRCLNDNDIFECRYRQIRDFERYLYENGTRILKFFLHVSKDEQKERFLERIDDPEKNWKFSEADIRERALWDDYQEAYKRAINSTATPYAPWFVIPADKKWFARLLISEIIVQALADIDPHYPTMPESKQALLAECREQLLSEDGGQSQQEA